MKKIEAIVRPGKFEKIKEALANEGFNGITVSNVMGRGEQKGRTYLYRGQEVVIQLLPKIKLEIFAFDEKVEQIIDIILEVGSTGWIGDGKIFVYPVGEVV